MVAKRIFGYGKAKKMLEPEAVRSGYWANKHYSFPVDLAMSGKTDTYTSTDLFEGLVAFVSGYVDELPKNCHGCDDPVQDVIFACQQGANRPLTAEAAHVETDVAHNMAGKVNSCKMGQHSCVKLAL